MKQVHECMAPHCFIIDVFEASDWQIAKKNPATTRRLPADIFGYIAYGHVDGIAGLVLEQCDLCLVR